MVTCTQVPLPAHVAQQPFDEVQFTLVDCPGHASLIRTIIGGAQIIDMMVLVIDVTKGDHRSHPDRQWLQISSSDTGLTLDQIWMSRKPDIKPTMVLSLR